MRGTRVCMLADENNRQFDISINLPKDKATVRPQDTYSNINTHIEM